MGEVRNPGTARAGQRTKILSALGLKFQNDVQIDSGALDPSVTARDAPKGSVYLSNSTHLIYVKADDGLTANWKPQDVSQYTKDPTGFIDNSNIGVAYSTTTRKVTLTNAVSGEIEFLLLGQYYSYPSPWTVPTVLGGLVDITAAIDGTAGQYGMHFLKIDPATKVISFTRNVPWAFSDLMICAAFSNATAEFGLREVHGLMPNQSHEENHYNVGTYIRAAIGMEVGSASVATAGTATNQTNAPGVQIGTIYDEDLPSLIAAWPKAVYTGNTYGSGVYTTAYRNGASGVIAFNIASQMPYLAAGGFIQRNPIDSAGSGSLAAVTANSHVNILVLNLPVTADPASQKFRTIFMTGQQEYTTVAAAQLESPAAYDFGELTSAIPEGVSIQLYTYQRAAAVGALVVGSAWLRATPVLFVGNRKSTLAVTGVSPTDHQALSNRGTASASMYHPASGIECAFTASALTILSSEVTVQSALEKLGLFATSTVGGLLSAVDQGIGGTKTFAALATFSLGLAIVAGQSLDTVAAGALNIGNATATSIVLGRVGAPVSIVDNTASTTSATGALKVAGGLGVAGAVFGGTTATFATSVSTPSLINGTSGVSIGSGVALNYNGPVHRLSGNICCQTPGTPNNPDSGQMTIGSNCYWSGRALRWSDGSIDAHTGAGIVFSNRPTNTTNTLSFVVNAIANSATTDATVVGGYNGLGAWTFPANTTHTFGDSATDAATYLQIKAGATKVPALRLFRNTEKWQIGADNNYGNDGLFFYSVAGSAYAGGVSTTGAWTLGAAGTTTAHLITNTATNDYGLYVTNADTGTSSGGLRVRCGGAGAGNIPLKIQRNDATDLFTVYGDKTIQCHGLGAGTVVSSATGVLSISSDSRLKISVESKLPGLAEVLQLSVEAYQWKSEIARIGDKAAVEIGYFADKVAPIIPSAAPMGHDGYYGLYDRSISAAHTNAIKELAALSDAKDAQIAALQQEINSIKERLAA